MKKKHFYSHLTPIDNIVLELNNIEVSEDEKTHLITIVSTNIHYSVLDTVLSDLTTEDKKSFLKHIENDNHQKTWEFLKEKIENAEEKIKKSGEKIIKEFLKDIQTAKKQKK